MKLMTFALWALLVQEPPQDSKNAQDLFKGALAQAKESKKRVFLTFGSPG